MTAIPTPLDAGTVPSAVPSLRRRDGVVRQLLARPLGVAALTTLLILTLVAIFAPLIAPFGDNDQDLMATYQGPSRDHLLGTDDLGRDVLSRAIFGTRIALVAGLQAVSIAIVIGVTFGILAGYGGRIADTLLSRFNDAMMSIPGLVLALTVVAVLGPGVTNAMVAIGIILTPSFFRISRAATLGVRHETYIEASVNIGCGRRRVIAAHVLPNILPPILVQASLALGTAVVAEASLSFLGLGVRPPAPSWGTMLALAGKRPEYGYLVIAPGIALVLLVLAFIILGDVLRDIVTGADS